MSGVKFHVEADNSQAKQKLAEVDKSLININNSVKSIKDSLSSAFKNIAISASLVGIGAILKDASDKATEFSNKLKTVIDSEEQLIRTQRLLLDISVEARTSLSNTGTLYSKFAKAADELAASQEDLLKVTTLTAKAIQLSGASADAANAAIVQLGQGLASGVLRGEELNSVLEQTPRLAQAIAEGMGTSLGKLRKLGAEGALTSDVVFSGLLSQADKLNYEFERSTATLSQTLSTLKSTASFYLSETLKGLSNGELSKQLSKVVDYLKDASEAAELNASIFIRNVKRSVGDLWDTVRGVSSVFYQLARSVITALPSIVTLKTMFDDIVGALYNLYFAAKSYFQPFASQVVKSSEDINRSFSTVFGLFDFQIPKAMRSLFSASNLREFNKGLNALAKGIDSNNDFILNRLASLPRKIKYSFEDLGIYLGLINKKFTIRTGYFEPLVDSLKEMTKGMKDGVLWANTLSGSMSPLGKLFGAITNIAMSFGYIMYTVFKNISAVLYELIQRMAEMAATLATIVQNSFLNRPWDDIADSAKRQLNKAYREVVAFKDNVIRAFFDIWDAVIGHSWWTDTIDSIETTSNNLWDNVSHGFWKFKRNVIGTFKDIFEESNAEKLKRLSSKTFENLSISGGLSSINTTIKNTDFKELTNDVINGLTVAFKTIKDQYPILLQTVGVGFFVLAFTQLFPQSALAQAISSRLLGAFMMGLLLLSDRFVSALSGGSPVGKLAENIGEVLGRELVRVISHIPGIINELFGVMLGIFKGFVSALPLVGGILEKVLNLPLLGNIISAFAIFFGGRGLIGVLKAIGVIPQTFGKFMDYFNKIFTLVPNTGLVGRALFGMSETAIIGMILLINGAFESLLGDSIIANMAAGGGLVAMFLYGLGHGQAGELVARLRSTLIAVTLTLSVWVTMIRTTYLPMIKATFSQIRAAMTPGGTVAPTGNLWWDRVLVGLQSIANSNLYGTITSKVTGFFTLLMDKARAFHAFMTTMSAQNNLTGLATRLVYNKYTASLAVLGIAGMGAAKAAERNEEGQGAVFSEESTSESIIRFASAVWGRVNSWLQENTVMLLTGISILAMMPDTILASIMDKFVSIITKFGGIIARVIMTLLGTAGGLVVTGLTTVGLLSIYFFGEGNSFSDKLANTWTTLSRIFGLGNKRWATSASEAALDKNLSEKAKRAARDVRIAPAVEDIGTIDLTVLDDSNINSKSKDRVKKAKEEFEKRLELAYDAALSDTLKDSDITDIIKAQKDLKSQIEKARYAYEKKPLGLLVELREVSQVPTGMLAGLSRSMENATKAEDYTKLADRDEARAKWARLIGTPTFDPTVTRTMLEERHKAAQENLKMANSELRSQMNPNVSRNAAMEEFQARMALQLFDTVGAGQYGLENAAALDKSSKEWKELAEKVTNQSLTQYTTTAQAKSLFALTEDVRSLLTMAGPLSAEDTAQLEKVLGVKLAPQTRLLSSDETIAFSAEDIGRISSIISKVMPFATQAGKHKLENTDPLSRAGSKVIEEQLTDLKTLQYAYDTAREEFRLFRAEKEKQKAEGSFSSKLKVDTDALKTAGVNISSDVLGATPTFLREQLIAAATSSKKYADLANQSQQEALQNINSKLGEEFIANTLKKMSESIPGKGRIGGVEEAFKALDIEEFIPKGINLPDQKADSIFKLFYEAIFAEARIKNTLASNLSPTLKAEIVAGTTTFIEGLKASIIDIATSALNTTDRIEALAKYTKTTLNPEVRKRLDNPNIASFVEGQLSKLVVGQRELKYLERTGADTTSKKASLVRLEEAINESLDFQKPKRLLELAGSAGFEMKMSDLAGLSSSAYKGLMSGTAGMETDAVISSRLHRGASQSTLQDLALRAKQQALSVYKSFEETLLNTAGKTRAALESVFGDLDLTAISESTIAAGKLLFSAEQSLKFFEERGMITDDTAIKTNRALKRASAYLKERADTSFGGAFSNMNVLGLNFSEGDFAGMSTVLKESLRKIGNTFKFATEEARRTAENDNAIVEMERFKKQLAFLEMFKNANKNIIETTAKGLKSQFDFIENSPMAGTMSYKSFRTLSGDVREAAVKRSGQIGMLTSMADMQDIPEPILRVLEKYAGGGALDDAFNAIERIIQNPEAMTSGLGDFLKRYEDKRKQELPEVLKQIDSMKNLEGATDRLKTSIERLIARLSGRKDLPPELTNPLPFTSINAPSIGVLGDPLGSVSVTGKKGSIPNDTLRAAVLDQLDRDARAGATSQLSKLSNLKQLEELLPKMGMSFDRLRMSTLDADEIANYTKTLSDLYNRRDILSRNESNSIDVVEALNAEILNFQNRIQAATKDMAAMSDQAGKSFSANAKDSITKGIKDIISGKSNLKEFGMTLLDSITNSIINNVVNGFVEGMFGKNGLNLDSILSTLGTKLYNWGASILGGGLADPGYIDVLGLATGGIVSGPGTGTSDSILARVSNGEFVVNASATARNRRLLEAINSNTLSKFSTGGFVNISPTSGNLSSVDNAGSYNNSVVNISITGDISRQTRSEIISLLPQITSGINANNRESGYRQR